MTRSDRPRAHNHFVTDLAINGGPKPEPSETCPRHRIPIKRGASRCAKGKKKGENCRNG